MTKSITLWLSIGSTYSYLTALRINTIKQEKGLKLFGKAYQHPYHNEINGQHSISAIKENEVDYMWRDIERRADWYDLPKSKPKLTCALPTASI